MNHKERFHAVMSYGDFDRPIFYMPSYGGFPETLTRWRSEGFNEEDLRKYNTDPHMQVSHLFFPHPPFEREVVEEEERHILYYNHEGILMREMKNDPFGSMPQFVRFPVETVEDFRKFAAERLQPDMAARLGANWVEQLKAWEAVDAPFVMFADRWGGFFGPLRNLLGVEALCMTFYTDPKFVEEMMDTVADFMIAMFDQILAHVKVDVAAFWEDMAFRKGPLIAPELVRAYMLPRYKRVSEFLYSKGVKYIGLDSDGDIRTLIPIWLDGGINYLWPFEPQASMDVVEVRREYGRELRMVGGLDKRALAWGREAIDREIARVRPLMEEGGYLCHPDHSLPPDIPYANFLYYMDRMADVIGA